MEEKRKEQKNDKNKSAQTISRTTILRNRPKKYDTKYEQDDGKRKYPPKTL